MVSLVPLLLVGWHVLRVDSRVLQSEILDKQRTTAHRIALLLSEAVNRKVQFFSVFTELHTDFEGHPLVDQKDIDYLQQKNPDILYISILNRAGQRLAYAGPENFRRQSEAEKEDILETCVEKGEQYIGSSHWSGGHLHVLLAFPLRQHRQDSQVSGVLVTELDLDELSSLLYKIYPDDMSVVVVTESGRIVSYSGQDPSAMQSQASTGRQLQQIQHKLGDLASAKLTLNDGEQLLVSSAEVPSLHWKVFALQPANAMRKLVSESLFHSVWDILAILLVLAVFVWAVGYWVLVPIIRPLQRLQEVAIKFEQEDNYIPTEQDLIIPDNEIGELARVFLHMAVVLFERKYSLQSAQQELASMNKELELRVQQRTAELKTATEQLVKTEQLATIGQMASIISHEIRNPLAVISNATRLIKTLTPPTNPKIIKQFAIIEAEIRQANSIIGEVLGFARSRDMILSTMDVNTYLHDLVLSFPVPANVHIKETFDAESALLKVDSEEIKQALRNLMANACEAMPEGGTVTVGTQTGRGVVCIYVADEGPGISDELKEKIFSPFYTTKARGTGLGLAVVRKAVARHKGKLFVRKGARQGAIFEIYLKIYHKTGDTRYDG